MKKQLLKPKVWSLKAVLFVFLAGLIFSMIFTKTSSAQTVLTGQMFVYQNSTNEADTTGLVGTNVYVKFYRLNSLNQLMFVAQAPINSQGYFNVKVYTSQDLYALIPSDDTQDNFSSTFYPGWLDFESADAIPIAGVDTVDFDWGAVGKEIVERPSGNAIMNTISGTVNTLIPNISDIVPMVSILDNNGNLVANAPVNSEGKYNLSFYGNGNYEVFTSIPGFVSQSKYVTLANNKGDINIDFNLDVYKGEGQQTVNTVANNFNLAQNYPNPFNPTTNINFTVNNTGIVKLTVYNSLGKEVTKLVNDLVEPGSYNVTFNAQNLSSGIYYYTLQVGNSVITKKMNLVK